MYITLSGLDKVSAAMKVQALTLCFLRETLMIIENLGLTEEQKGDMDTTNKAHTDDHINMSMEWHKLRRHVQKQSETLMTS